MSYGGGYGGASTYPQPGGYGAPTPYGSAPPPPAPYGGSAYPTSPGGFGPPAGADPQLWQWFSSVDEDRSGAITAQELQRCLINGDWSPFDLDTVKLLMSIFDTDRTGTIGFAEFSGLWKYIKDWQNVFRHFDRDRSGTIDSQELDDALRQFGYNLSPQLRRLLLAKYATETPSRRQLGPPPGITFDRFVRACVVVKQLTESFQRLDAQRTGWVQLSYDTFMETVLAAP